MNARQNAIKILNEIPDHKIGYVLSFLQGFKLSEEIEDDIYCEKLYNDYLNDTSIDKNETVSLAAAAEQLGIKL